MKRVLYTKYNKMRRESFQIKTQICEEDGELYAEKYALRPEGAAHIARFCENCRKMNSIYENVSMLEAEPVNGGIRYPYLQAPTLDELLTERIEAGEDAVQVLGAALDRLLTVSEGGRRPFEKTQEFTEVFGLVKRDQGTALTVSNIDMLFENIMVQGERWICLDYEWVFDFPVPLDFVRYRIILYYYRHHSGLFESRYDVTGLLERLGIDRPMAIQYAKMEKAFQEYVHGKDNCYTYLNRYARQSMDFDKTIYDYKTEIESLNTAVQLKENHIQNLNGLIAGQQEIIDKYSRLKNIAKKFGAKPVYNAARKVYHAGQKLVKKTNDKEKNSDSNSEVNDNFLKKKKSLRFPQAESPLVSVIIPVYNQIAYTWQCLESILKNTEDVAYEIIIADDQSSDDTVKLAQKVSGIHICRTPENLGFLKNCNLAAKQARGKYILFLNNDTEVCPGWLKSLVELIESDPSIGMVGSKFIYPDGRLQEAGGILWSNGSGWNYGRFDDPDKAAYNYVKDVDYISGACIMLPLALWRQLGGFDERFAPAYCEDADLAFAVRDAGYRVVYQPKSVVIHHEGISNGTDISSGMKHYQTENSVKLREKWAEEFALQTDYSDPPALFEARERSQGRKTILVIDHYVPQYDKDAGSRSTFTFIRMFLNHGYVVKFIGDNFNHDEPYTTTLEQMGVEVLYGDEFRDGRILNWIEVNGDYIDFAFLNRPHITVKYLTFIREHTNIKCIYYGHDLNYVREGREYELTGDRQLLEDAEHWKKQEYSIMRNCEAVYYPSTVEEEIIRQADPSIPVKSVSVYSYDSFRDEGEIPSDFNTRKGMLFVGGFAHRPNVDAVEWLVREIYPEMLKLLGTEADNVPFYIVGSQAPREITDLDGTDGAGHPGAITVKGYVSDEELARLYDSCRLVVCPLRFGAGVKGKVIEAIYYGIPMITTSIGAEGIPEVRSVVTVEDEACALARKAVSLYQDTDRLAQISGDTQNYIRKYFSMDALWEKVKEDFR